MQFKGAIFDLDGTLLNSMGVFLEVDRVFFGRRNILYDLEEYQCEIGSLGFEDAAIYTKTKFQLSDSIEEIMAEWLSLTAEEYRDKVELKPFAYEYLKKLHESGVKLCVATANEERAIIPCLERLNVREFFSSIVTVTEVGKNKNFPDVYLECARRMGLECSEIAVFEDILTAILTAKRAGFKTVGVYDKTSEKDRQSIIDEADLFIMSYEELL